MYQKEIPLLNDISYILIAPFIIIIIKHFANKYLKLASILQIIIIIIIIIPNFFPVDQSVFIAMGWIYNIIEPLKLTLSNMIIIFLIKKDSVEPS